MTTLLGKRATHALALDEDVSDSDRRIGGQLKRREPTYQAFLLLRVGFTVAPLLFGIDKYANLMTNWAHYLAPWINNLMPGTAHQFMFFVGAVEILAGLVVATKPRYGGYLVAAWLAGIVINLLSYPGFYDIALRDFGLLLAALTLARLAQVWDPPLAILERRRPRSS